MKNIIFFLLLVSSFHQKAVAACTDYGYFVDASGFICKGSTKGSICIVSKYDWACHDGAYEVRLSFPTGSFTPEPGGPFTVLSSNAQTTVLHAPYSPPTAGQYSVCIEGELNGSPGPIFSVGMVLLSNPGVTISPTTFTVDEAKTIGSNVGVGTITEAIIQGLVLDPAISSGLGQRIVIDGTLEISESYTFGSQFGGIYNEIKMMPGSSIEINGNQVLSTFRTDISDCFGTWNRILVKEKGTFNCNFTNIQNAQTAIELVHLSKLNFSGSQLRGNEIGIGSFGANLKTLTLNILPGNAVFVNTSSISDGLDGIHLENVNPVTIPGLLTIRNMTGSGIHLRNTDLTGDHLTFKNCQTGVQVVEENDYLYLNACTFEDGTNGIASAGTLEMQIVNDNTFTNIGYGILKLANSPNDHSLIENNYFDASCYADIIGFIYPSKAEIQKNQLNASQINVGLIAYGTGTHKWYVRQNNDMSSFNNNVGFYSTNGARFYENVNPIAFGSNVEVSNGSRNALYSNKGCTAGEENIIVTTSPRAYISNNELSGLHGIKIVNNCNFSTIRCNTMSSAAENLVYGSGLNGYAHTGKQPFRANVFDPSSVGSIKAINNSEKPVAELNQYKVTLSSTPQGSQYFPFFTSAFDKWFKDTIGNQTNCSIAFTDVPDEKDELEESIDGGIVLLKSGIEKIYGKEVAFDAELKLLRDLNALKKITPALSKLHEQWYSLLNGSDLSGFIQFENAFASAIQLSKVHESKLNELSAQTLLLANKIKALGSPYTVDELTGRIDVIKETYTAYNDLIAQRDEAVAQIKAILNPGRKALDAKLSIMKKILDAMPDNKLQSYQNLKKVNYLLLKRFDGTFKKFDERDKAELENLANQCASLGGEGVLVARNLLAEITLDLKPYNDECIPSSLAQVRSTAPDNVSSSEVKVSPNPSDAYITVTLPESQLERQISISDVFGKPMYTKTVEAGVNQIGFATASAPPGIYFVHIAGSKQVTKFIIAR